MNTVKYLFNFLCSVYSSFKRIFASKDLRIDDRNMEGRQTRNIDLSYRRSKELQSKTQVERYVCQWTEEGIACYMSFFLFY